MLIKAQAEHHKQLLQRHDSAAHLLVEVMQERFSEAQLVNKHANVEGFICEIALASMLSPADLAVLEQHMAQLIARNWPCGRAYWSYQQALAYFRQHGRAYQVAQLVHASDAGVASQYAYAANYPQFCGSFSNAEWPADVLIYQHGDFVDLCSGSHVEYMSEIGVCKLLRVEVVHGSEGLQRIYGSVEA